MSDSSNFLPCCCMLIVVLMLGSIITDPGDDYRVYDSEDYEPSVYNGTFHVVNDTLTNGTYNTTNLNNMMDVVNSYDTYFDVVPSGFVFVYNDGENSDKYNGDAGLLYSVFNDTVTGATYRVDKALTRGIAYYTNGTFNLSDGCSIRRQRKAGDNYYTIYYITLENGSRIESLNIYDNLTAEQKKYFDDYDEQLYRYYSEKQIKQLKSEANYLADLDTEMSVQNSVDLKS